MLRRLRDLLLHATDAIHRPSPEPGPDHPAEVAVAALLLQTADADDHLDVLEQAAIGEALRKHFALDRAGVEDLLARAEAARREAIGDHEFTRVILRECDENQRVAIVMLIWSVVLADGDLTADESLLARRLGHLLDLRPEQVAVAIQRARGRGKGDPRGGA